MIQLIKKEYERKSQVALVPLIGVNKKHKFCSFLFWKDRGIDNNEIILKFEFSDRLQFEKYIKEEVIKEIIDGKKCDITEIYYNEKSAILIVNMSYWFEEIKNFKNGKYSAFSKEAKDKIEKYHTSGLELSVIIKCMLYPNIPILLLDNKTAIDYMSENYQFPKKLMKNIGEIMSIYNKDIETLDSERE